MYPVQRLFPNITADFQKYAALNIPEAFAMGLKNEINVIDQDGPMTDFAHISKNKAGNRFEVALSAAYCQVIWLLCDAMVCSADYQNILSICRQSNMSPEDLIAENNRILILPDDVFLSEMKLSALQIPPTAESIKKFKDFIRHENVLLSAPDLGKRLEDELKAALSLLPGNGPLSPEVKATINSVDMSDNGYGGMVNGCCVKAVSFVLLHELSHCVLGHFSAKDIMRIEAEADENAYKKMYDSCPAEERFTVGIGLLCSAFALLFSNPTMKHRCTDIHPREDRRILAVYDHIMKGATPEHAIKYAIMLLYLFNFWGRCFKIPGYQQLPTEDSASVTRLRDFLAAYKEPIRHGPIVCFFRRLFRLGC